MKRAALAVAGLLLATALAHATLGVVTAAALLKGASKVAIVIVDAHDRGTVATAYRGLKAGDVVDAYTGGTSGAALYVCDGDDCATGLDTGGYYILHLPGRKAPVEVLPGIFEASAVAGLVEGSGAKPLCVHVHLHFIDAASSDVVLDGKFAAEDGKGTLKGKLLGPKPLAAELVVGGPTHEAPEHATIRLASGVTLTGGPFIREQGGCFVMTALPAPLSRTPARFAADVAGKIAPLPIARGTLKLRGNDAPIAVGNDGSIVSAVVGKNAQLETVVNNHDLRFRYRDGGDQLYLIFADTVPHPVVFAPPAAWLAALVADGKPHAFIVGLETGKAYAHEPVPIGKGSLTAVVDP